MVDNADKLIAERSVARQVTSVPNRRGLPTFLAQIGQQVLGHEQSDMVAFFGNNEVDLGGRGSVGKASRVGLPATPVDSGAVRGQGEMLRVMPAERTG